MNWLKFCVLKSTVYLNEAMSRALMHTAHEMAYNHSPVRHVKAEGMEGRIVTHFGYACLGGMSGMRFEAEVETDRGRGKVAYLVDIERADLVREQELDTRWVNRWREDQSDPNPHPGEKAYLN